MVKESVNDFLGGSSDVDWCEANYDMTKWIAEFYNTISNALFFFLPPLFFYLNRQYAERVTKNIALIWLLLIVVGINSVYFHATLSLIGQLLDEISIVWVIMGALALWMPKSQMPTFLQRNRKKCKTTMLTFAVLTSLMGLILPGVNNLVLFAFGFPCAYILIKEIKRCQCPRVYYLGIRCVLTYAVAVLCWISDKFFCQIWATVNFPYLHSFWHILVAISSCSTIVSMTYFNSLEEIPEQRPTLQYWPNNKWEFWGLPYISFKALKSSSNLFV